MKKWEFRVFAAVVIVCVVGAILILEDLSLLNQGNQRQAAAANYNEISDVFPAGAKGANTFVLIRAIGNSLPPRHAPNQSLCNVKFILEHEQTRPNVRRHFLLNRLLSKMILQQLIELLEAHREHYSIVPFRLADYAKMNMLFPSQMKDFVHEKAFRQLQTNQKYYFLDVFYNNKNIYLTNNNYARNMMIDIGLQYNAKWILPWDGNCFMTAEGWSQLETTVEKHGESMRYFFTPMDRIKSGNHVLLDPMYHPNAVEEPQIIFRRDAKARFNPRFRYGRRDKVELLIRLKVKGKWDKWKWEPWESKLDPSQKFADDIGNNQIISAGWVARLYSGNKKAEKEKGGLDARGMSRSFGLISQLKKLDIKVAENAFNYSPRNLLYFNQTTLSREKAIFKAKNRINSNRHLISKIEDLIGQGNSALKNGPWTVMDKANVPPSGNKHDYYSCTVPLSNDESCIGLDKDRLVEFGFHTTILALSWYFTDNAAFAIKASENIRRFFVTKSTRMNPNMMYAQYNHAKLKVSKENYQSGIIELKGLPYILDSIRLSHLSGHLKNSEYILIQKWMRKYLEWLLSSIEGVNDYLSADHRGIYYDNQVVALASFVNDTSLLLSHGQSTMSRLTRVIDEKGMLVKETKQAQCEQSQLLTMEGWLTFSRLFMKVNSNAWNFRDNSINDLTGDMVAVFHRGDRDAKTIGLNVEIVEKFDKFIQALSPLCMAAVYANPFISRRKNCNSGNAKNVDINRWLSIYFEAVEYCNQDHMKTYAAKLQGSREKDKLHWMNVKKIESQLSNYLYEVKSMYSNQEDTGLSPFWNLGLSTKYY